MVYQDHLSRLCELEWPNLNLGGMLMSDFD